MFARDLWQRIETLHAVTYFGPETQEATAALGVTGFWSGYFGLRAAPLGAVTAGVVEASFANFAPAFVRRWVPAVWDVATPADLIEARSRAAAATLRRVAPSIERAAEAGPLLQEAIGRDGATNGLPLYAANRDLALPADPVESLWQTCTTLREHRGDLHVLALRAASIDGLESHVLRAAVDGSDPDDLQRTRGWSADDWDQAVARLDGRGLLDPSVHRAVEDQTDRLAGAPFAALDEEARATLLDLLTPAAVEVGASGTLRYPNPIGLPPLA